MNVAIAYLNTNVDEDIIMKKLNYIVEIMIDERTMEYKIGY